MTEHKPLTAEEAGRVVGEVLSQSSRAWADVSRLVQNYTDLLADRARLAAEVESLRAVVERLPKTADGVVLVPELDSVFHPGFDSEGDIERSGEVEWVGMFYAADADGTGTVWTYPVSNCYSTRAAAEAARLTGKGNADGAK